MIEIKCEDNELIVCSHQIGHYGIEEREFKISKDKYKNLIERWFKSKCMKSIIINHPISGKMFFEKTFIKKYSIDDKSSLMKVVFIPQRYYPIRKETKSKFDFEEQYEKRSGKI